MTANNALFLLLVNGQSFDWTPQFTVNRALFLFFFLPFILAFQSPHTLWFSLNSINVNGQCVSGRGQSNNQLNGQSFSGQSYKKEEREEKSNKKQN